MFLNGPCWQAGYRTKEGQVAYNKNLMVYSDFLNYKAGDPFQKLLMNFTREETNFSHEFPMCFLE